ncbi:hypothetical protein PH210_23925 [Paenibacillus sp. BSR1-1]|nr:hypothetical protein [Paenibacillus sp. BSR1-1]MDN3019224.1 hypothetical protein [Paenibacillus sp. BSR1-1]
MKFFYKKMAKLKLLDDWSGRRETPAGGRGRGDPAGAVAPSYHERN